MDQLANKYSNTVVFIVNSKEESASFLAKSNSSVDASYLVKEIALLVGGNGGGNKTFAQGGCKSKVDVSLVLERVKQLIK